MWTLEQALEKQGIQSFQNSRGTRVKDAHGEHADISHTVAVGSSACWSTDMNLGVEDRGSGRREVSGRRPTPGPRLGKLIMSRGCFLVLLGPNSRSSVELAFSRLFPARSEAVTAHSD